MDGHMKCVIVGGGDVGKSSLKVTLYKGTFPSHFGGDNAHSDYTVKTDVDGHTVAVNIWDTASPGKGLDQFRHFTYTDADVVLLCFSLVSPSTLTAVEELFIDEIRQYCKNAPTLLVGLKKDLRDEALNKEATSNEVVEFVGTSDGERVCSSIGADRYMEVSALTGEGLKLLMEEVVRTAYSQPKMKKCERCVVS